MNNVIEVVTIMNKYEGEDVLIACVWMIPTDLLFNFKGLRFPAGLTINKSQGQLVEVCAINL